MSQIRMLLSNTNFNDNNFNFYNFNNDETQRLLQNNINITNSGGDVVHAFIVTPDYLAITERTYEEIQTITSASGFVDSVNSILQPDYLGPAVFKSVHPIPVKPGVTLALPILLSNKSIVVVSDVGGTVPFSILNQAGFISLVVGDQWAVYPSAAQVKYGQTGNGTKAVYAST